MNPSGLARTETEIQDLSFLIAGGLVGIVGVLGVTEFGTPNEPKLIGSWLEYQRHFGGLLADSDFPLLCKRALDNGAKLKVSRVAHYATITDKSTIAGVKATGTITATTNSAVFTAKNVGAGGNKITVTVASAASGAANRLDITITVAGFTGAIDLTQIVRDVPKNPTATEKLSLNQELKLVDVGTVTGEIPIGTATLATGAQVVADIVATDYVGAPESATGLYSFDNSPEIWRIAVPEKADPAIDAGVSVYVNLRGNIAGILRTPVGVDGETAVDYREGTGTFSHTALDNWRLRMVTGGLKITHPLTGIEKEISEIGDFIGLLSKRDNNTYPWFSESGSKRGRIPNALGVVYNFGTSARGLEADNVVTHGITPIIDHPSFGIVAWGNGTLSKANTLLKNAEVAELILYLQRGLNPLIETELFEPNDIDTWKTIYRKVKPFMDDIVTNRGVWKYLYQGDQDIDVIEDAQVNTPEGIDAGKYEFYLFVAPKVNMKYIGIKVAITNSGVDYTAVDSSAVIV